jgi:hypothetical protein
LSTIMKAMPTPAFMLANSENHLLSGTVVQWYNALHVVNERPLERSVGGSTGTTLTNRMNGPSLQDNSYHEGWGVILYELYLLEVL